MTKVFWLTVPDGRTGVEEASLTELCLKSWDDVVGGSSWSQTLTSCRRCDGLHSRWQISWRHCPLCTEYIRVSGLNCIRAWTGNVPSRRNVEMCSWRLCRFRIQGTPSAYPKTWLSGLSRIETWPILHIEPRDFTVIILTWRPLWRL